VLLLVLLLCFFLHPVTELDVGTVAIGGALILMLIDNRHSVHYALKQVEWEVLIFFISLFILIEGLGELNLMRFVAESLAEIIGMASEANRLSVALILILWVSAILAAFIDNIPYVATLIPIIKHLAFNPLLNLPVRPLVWTLSIATCLGGNGTIVGASANVVVCGMLDKNGWKVSFKEFLRVGFPTMLISIAISNVYIMVVYVWLGWGH